MGQLPNLYWEPHPIHPPVAHTHYQTSKIPNTISIQFLLAIHLYSVVMFALHKLKLVNPTQIFESIGNKVSLDVIPR